MLQGETLGDFDHELFGLNMLHMYSVRYNHVNWRSECKWKFFDKKYLHNVSIFKEK